MNYESFFEKIVSLPINEVTVNEEIKRQLEQYQYELIGLSFSEHPLTKIKANYLSSKKIVDLVKATTIGQVYNVIVTLTSLRTIKTKTGLDMAFLTIEDDTYLINKVALFPGLYTKLHPTLAINEIYTMTIKPTTQGYQLLSADKINK
jgi:DNA polymerase-3 subunit alpha